MLENVFKAVDENNQLDGEFRENVKELITIFNKFFPNISLDNFENRVKTLRVERINKLVSKRVYNYNPIANVLSFSIDKLQGEYDAKHILMSSLLCMITAHDNTFGFDKDNRLVTLNMGYTEILSNFLVGNDADGILFEDEIIATNIISEIIGNDVLFEAYFSNQPNLVSDALVNADDNLEIKNGGTNNVVS